MLFFEGVMKNLGRFPRRYFRIVCPKKSNPVSICVMTVFVGESCNPRSLRNCSTSGLTCWPVSAMLTKRSGVPYNCG